MVSIHSPKDELYRPTAEAIGFTSPGWRNAEGMIPKPGGSSRLADGRTVHRASRSNLAETGGCEPLTLRLVRFSRPVALHNALPSEGSSAQCVSQYRRSILDEQIRRWRNVRRISPE